MTTKNIKKKVAAKVAKGKAKVARKCGSARGKCAAVIVATTLVALADLVAGCTSPAQRAQTAEVRQYFYVYEGATANFTFGSEFVSLAQSNETGGNDAGQVTTNTVDVPITVRYNDAIQSASAATRSVLGSIGDGLGAVLDLILAKKSGKVSVTKRDGSAAVVKCENGECEWCEDCDYMAAEK